MQSNVIAKRVLLPTLSKNLCSANRSWLTLPPVEEKCVCVSVCTLGGGGRYGCVSLQMGVQMRQGREAGNKCT